MSLATSEHLTCGVKTDKTLLCLGAAAPVLAQEKGVVEVQMGAGLGCLRYEGGKVDCWVNRYAGSASLMRLGIRDAEDLVVGDVFACAHTASGVRCFGYVSSRDTTPRDLRDVVAFGTRGGDICVQHTTGTVSCIDPRDTEPRVLDVKVPAGGRLVAEGTSLLAKDTSGHLAFIGGERWPSDVDGNVTSAAFGGHFKCVVVDGAVRCWGERRGGVFGDGTTDAEPSPVQMSDVGRISELAMSDDAVCAIVGSDLRCWEHERIAKQTLTGIQHVALGSSHGCGIYAGGTVRCWGTRADGRVGDVMPKAPTPGVLGSIEEAAPPTAPRGVGSARSIGAGMSHTCALLTSGSVSCWGTNTGDELGRGRPSPAALPALVPNLHEVTALSVGVTQACALRRDGTLACFGDVAALEVDDIRKTKNLLAVPGVKDVTSFAVGTGHGCAADSKGGVICWGAGPGTGSPSSAFRAPSPVPGLNDARKVYAGYTHTCVIKKDETVACWGDNEYGQLGDGTFVDRLEPTPVKALSHVRELVLGQYRSCALLTDGTARCWGRNEHDALGLGRKLVETKPVPVPMGP